VRYAVSCFFSLIVCFAFAQQMRIGVLSDHVVKRASFAYNNGSYSIYGDSTDFGSILPNEFIEITWENEELILRKGITELGKFKKVFLVQNRLGTSLTLTAKIPVVKQRKYKDDFEIFPNSKGLTIVNLVDMDNYLAGVVESEGGGGKNIEYYKVQALMSRTYALKYREKHIKDGFELCDRVHCQAYHNMLQFTPIIDSAVAQTRNLVMLDEKGNFIDSYFHANCGGQTSETGIVWNKDIDYLNSFLDTFCVFTKQATWEKRVDQEKWKNFLVSRYNYPIQDSIAASMVFTFHQPERMAFYLHPVFGIPLRDLREEFNLKSTFFSCSPDGADVVIRGRGFGHGVGLCQEGAMKMAKLGFTFEQIAAYYFPKLHILNLQDLLFFKQQSSLFELQE
jgi:stage II sporulation protein D